MTSTQVWKLTGIGIIFFGMNCNVLAEVISDPCAGDSALLNIVDRPTIGDSACAVPFKKAVLELGYEYQKITRSGGYQQNFPEAEFRLGLPANNEFVLVLPNYIHQSITPHSGLSATTVGIKHEIGYNKTWLTAVEGLFTLPNGSAAFGSQGTGVALNGIVDYTFNSAWSITCMFGATSQTQSSFNGGQRYTSINPDIILTYVLNPKVDLYGESYGQTRTGPGQGSGFNFDGGILYLPIPNLEVDLEVGQRISGNLYGFNHYVGAGMSVMF